MDTRTSWRRARWAVLLIAVAAITSMASACDGGIGVGIGIYTPGPYSGRYPGDMVVPGGPIIGGEPDAPGAR